MVPSANHHPSHTSSALFNCLIFSSWPPTRWYTKYRYIILLYINPQFNLPLKMPQYKFVTVEGGTRKPAKLTRSIRSHSIRTALQKSSSSAHQSTIKAAGPRSRISDPSNDGTPSRGRKCRDAAVLALENGAPMEVGVPLSSPFSEVAYRCPGCELIKQTALGAAAASAYRLGR